MQRSLSAMKDETARLPIWHGGIIVAHALVDAADYMQLARYRWRIRSKKYAYPHRVIVTGKMIRTCEELMLARVVAGVPPGIVVKHRNGDLLDCPALTSPSRAA